MICKYLYRVTHGKKTIHWVSWEKVNTNKDNGGLWVRSLKSLNISLLVKWWWRLRSEPFTLWEKVITWVYKLSDKGDDYYSMKTMIGVWNNITVIKRELERKDIPDDKIIKKHQDGICVLWKCDFTGDENYKVSGLRHILEDNGPVHIAKFSLIKEIPLKVLCFIWRAKGGCIPLAATLTKRGINFQPPHAVNVTRWKKRLIIF